MVVFRHIHPWMAVMSPADGERLTGDLMQSDWSDDFDDDYADDDYGETFDDDSAELLPCPQCGAEIYEEAQQCPACGHYIVHTSNAWSGRSIGWIVLGLLGIVAVILALSLGR